MSGSKIRSPIELVAVGALLLVVACSDMDQAAPVMVINHRDESPEVSYRVVTADVEYVLARMTLGAGSALQFAFPFNGERCAPGRLVATAAGKEVATQDRPCQGGRWEIDAVDASPSSGSTSDWASAPSR